MTGDIPSNQDVPAKDRLSPSVLFAFFCLSLTVVFSMRQEIQGLDAGREAINVFVSFVIVCVLWVVLQVIVPFSIYGKRTAVLVNAIFFARIGLGLAHFYWCFAPAAGIANAYDLPDADFSGDFVTIQNAALIFDGERSIGGLGHAIVGGYWRAINNPGVGVLYGAIYGAFGPFATAAVPWSALAMGIAASAIGGIGRLLKVELPVMRASILLMLLMPAFFITPPIYRDPFIVLLLLLIAYASLHFYKTHSLLSLLILLPLSIMVGSLRSIYLLFPIMAVVVPYCEGMVRGGLTRRNLRNVALVIVLTITALYFCRGYIQFARFVDLAFATTHKFNVIQKLAILGPVFYYGGVVAFSLLSPMPWWQSAHPSLLAYQVINYLQTPLTLVLVIALVIGFKQIKHVLGYGSLIAMYVVIYSYAMIGSLNLGAGYFLVGLPLVILPAAQAAAGHWKKYFTMSLIIVVLAHLFLVLL